MVTTRAHDGDSKGKDVVSDFQRTSLDLKNKIAKQFSEIMAVLNRSRDDKLCVDQSTLDSSGFNRPDPKPIYEIKADKEIPKASSKSKRRYKLQKRISCEELDERTMKGLCVFCGEQETPYHRLQHKNDVILMIDSEDYLSDSMVNEIGNEISSDRWLSNSIGCELEIGETDNDHEDRVPSDSDLLVNDIEKVKKDLVAIDVDSETDLLTENYQQFQEQAKNRFTNSVLQPSLVPQLYSLLKDQVHEVREENSRFENHKNWVQPVLLEEDSTMHFHEPGSKYETSKPAVYDRPFQIRVWDSGGSPPERVDDESSGDDKSSEVIAAETVVKLMHKLLMDNKYSFVDESSGKDVKVLEEQQGLKAQVCSGFDVKALIGLETYGWEYKKQMLILTRSYVVDVLSLDDGVFITEKRLLENRDEMGRDVTLRSLLGLTFGRRRQKHQAVCEKIIMVNVQSSLKLFHQLRVACLHHTSLGFLYGSLPRPPDENHSKFSNMLQYHETWSCISLRTNRVWDPGGFLVDAATPCLLSLHFTALHFIAAILSFLKNLEVKVSPNEGDLLQETGHGLGLVHGPSEEKMGCVSSDHED